MLAMLVFPARLIVELPLLSPSYFTCENSMSIKENIHKNFSQMGGLIYQWPKLTLLLALFVTALCCFSLGSLRIDTSNESNFDVNHPSVKVYREFHELYGFEEAVVVMIKTDEVFDLGFLQKLSDFHQRIEDDVVYLDDVKSIINTSVIYGEGDDLIVDDLQLSFPEDEVQLATFKQRALQNTVFTDVFLSKTQKYTAVLIYQDPYSPALIEGKKQAFSSQEQHKFMVSIRSVMAEFQGDNFDMSVTGGPVIGNTILSNIAWETPVFALLSNVVIIVLLFALFRRVSAVLLPLLVVNVSLASLFGLMAFFDTALSSFSQILPSFILTVGVCDSVHFLSHFYRRYEEHNDKKLAIEQALSHTGMPMMLTSLTTAVGMLSFSMSDIVPVRSLGFFAASGVMIVWFYTIVLLPALLALLTINPDNKGGATLGKSQVFLTRCGQLGWRHPYKVIGFFSVLLILSGIGISQLRFQHDPVKWFTDDSELPQSLALMNEEFNGSLAVEVLIDTGKENGVKSVAVLKKLDELNQFVPTFSAAGVNLESSRSIVDTVKQVHFALNANDKNYYAVPDSAELIAQEVLLFEMSGGDDLTSQVNSDFSIARVTMLGQWRDLLAYADFLEQFEVEVIKLVGDVGNVSFTGVVYLMSPMQKLAMLTMANSYTSAALVIAIMMILMMGSIRLGLLSMIPNLLPIILGMGFMAATGLALDMYTILIGSIAIGLVVDDTMHFVHGFQYNYEKTGNAGQAITDTLDSTGNALLFTTILLFGGFITYSFSSMVNISAFGLILGVIVIVALIADIILLPALLRLVYGDK